MNRNEIGWVETDDGFVSPFREVDGQWVGAELAPAPEFIPPAARAATLARAGAGLEAFERDGVRVEIASIEHNTLDDLLEVHLTATDAETGEELWVDDGHFVFHNPPVSQTDDHAGVLEQIVVDAILRVQP